MNFVQQLNRFLDPIRVRIRMLICRAIVSFIDDSKGIQIVQLDLMKDETKDGVERVQNYGFTSHPVPDAEAVVVFIGGNRDHGLCLAVDDSRHRLKDLPEGGVAMYHKDGHFIKLTDDGIQIENNNTKLEIIQGNAKVTLENGTVTVLGDQIQVGGPTALPVTPPAVNGSFCGLTNCLFTGGPHLTNKVQG